MAAAKGLVETEKGSKYTQKIKLRPNLNRSPKLTLILT